MGTLSEAEGQLASDPTNAGRDDRNAGIWQRIGKRLNFYRIHILFFCFTPLIFSVVFWASNGRYKISYIDSLFNCVSAMTVCGLATVNLSTLTGFQQALLFMQMSIGNPVIVSWVMVLIRKFFFAKKFEHILQNAAMKEAEKVVDKAQGEKKPWPHRIVAIFTGRHISIVDEENRDEDAKHKERGGVMGKLRPDMIRRMDDAPKLVNPSGWVTEGPGALPRLAFPNRPPALERRESSLPRSPSSLISPSSARIPVRRSMSADESSSRHRRRLSDPGTPSRPSSPAARTKMQRYETVAEAKSSPTASPKKFPRTHTVEFAPTPRRPRLGQSGIPAVSPLQEEPQWLRPPLQPHPTETRSQRSRRPSISAPLSIHTQHTQHTHHSIRDLGSMHRDFGGFPMPWTIIRKIIERMFPGVKRKLARTMTMPATVSIAPSRSEAARPEAKQVPYISFEAIVGRNSAFHLLTTDQLDEVGGVEYRALNALLWIVPLYHILIQLIAFIIITPYISRALWRDVFTEQQVRPINTVWYSAFQVVSSYTNTGMSLVDQSMLPFQSARVMILVMIVLVLAGNTSFPIFLRFSIWVSSKIIRKDTRLSETLQFLLDHPRRCFIYLFPSHQTWFLLTIVLGLTMTDWFFFLILDLGDSVIQQIPVNIRVLDGFMQAIAVRAAGFGIVPLASIAPAVKVLYVVMMYISVYPIAMSVRSTNVYEEQSLGVFHEPDGGNDEENTFETSGPRLTVWSRYLAMHARKQLAFDMWWMALSLFVICIIERGNIENPDFFGWFNIFNIMFELVSAYGTVGLSLGIPDQNYSFVGAMHPLSKLIICVVMLRGRHRGLPVAIDRAIMLPTEMEKNDETYLDNPNEPEGGEPNRQPFRYSETMMSHHSGSEMRHRQSYRPSKRFSGENLRLVPERHERFTSSEGSDDSAKTKE